ncbi:MAG: hypothetical protein J6S22_04325, partial [Clostridia bacterium]|nr:hypothetical protein [Clostridia bacterium]
VAIEHFKEDFVYKIRSAIKEAYIRRDELNRIILKMMARNIEARYQTPAPLIDDLEAYLHNSNAAPESKKRGSVPKLTLPRKNVNPVAVSGVVPVVPADKNV